jgi:hypothetical protein
MRIYSDIDSTKERVIVTFSGEITLYDITEMVTTSGKARVLHFRLLADARQARFQLQPDDIPKFSQLLRELAAQSRLGRTAVWVADEADRAVVQMLADLAKSLCEVDGFLERGEAERWLGWAD